MDNLKQAIDQNRTNSANRKRDQNASRRRGSGRRRITTTAEDRYLLQCARRRRTLTARQLASQLSAAEGRPISRQTVSHRLHERGLLARRPVVCVPLSPSHVRALLHRAREHRSWTPEQWSHVLFADESRFNIQNDSRRAIIWREPGTRYRAPNMVERDHYRGDGLPVWAAIATNGRTDLYVFAGVPSQLSDIATKSYTTTRCTEFLPPQGATSNHNKVEGLAFDILP
ncbi:hypothetical protein AVEN_88007-1 [Araneus ventricosus]|uniref:Transposase Tc1-like domain-containing protein n=1 Tax=Araneus ventricosus TaxID=182803 RepID=A0A4Y2FYA3_ARAVE|nr:hypothetical protein AVEN_88007-1 [Araneus ventricosus]